MTNSIYGSRAGNAAHTGFVPGSGVQAHSAGGLFPLIISTVENHDTLRCHKVVFHGGTGVELYKAAYRLNRAYECLKAGQRAENAARHFKGIDLCYNDADSQLRDSEFVPPLG